MLNVLYIEMFYVRIPCDTQSFHVNFYYGRFRHSSKSFDKLQVR